MPGFPAWPPSGQCKSVPDRFVPRSTTAWMQEQLPRVQGGIKACHPWLLDSATAPCVTLSPASLQSSTTAPCVVLPPASLQSCNLCITRSHALRGNAVRTAPAVRDAERPYLGFHAERGNQEKSPSILRGDRIACASFSREEAMLG
jgi:hypothetical protein